MIKPTSILPPTDLNKLAQDVLQGQSGDAALPCNLTDQWLDLISRDLDVCLGDLDAESETPSKSHLAAPLALIVHLLFAKQGGGQVKLTFDELDRHLVDLRIEVALEQVTRRTNFSASRATVQTIFTKRTVEFENTTG